MLDLDFSVCTFVTSIQKVHLPISTKLNRKMKTKSEETGTWSKMRKWESEVTLDDWLYMLYINLQKTRFIVALFVYCAQHNAVVLLIFVCVFEVRRIGVNHMSNLTGKRVAQNLQWIMLVQIVHRFSKKYRSAFTKNTPFQAFSSKRRGPRQISPRWTHLLTKSSGSVSASPRIPAMDLRLWLQASTISAGNSHTFCLGADERCL